MTPSQSAKLVAVLLGAFPSAKTTPMTSGVYEQLLADLDYAVADSAVRRIIATSRYPTLPTIGEIRAACVELTEGPRRAGGDAWGDVRKAIGSKGSYRMPGRDFQFDDPLVAKAINAMGWQELCLSENQAADRARFTQLYDHLAADARREATIATLAPGTPERQLASGANELVKDLVSRFTPKPEVDA